MAKRFTETEKWKDPWYQDLSPELKMLWQYITDQCDQAGVWTVNRKMAEFSIGAHFDWVASLEAFQGRVIPIDDGKKWWIKKFIEFQFGRLSRDCKPHLPIIALLAKHGISQGDVPQSSGPGKTHNVSDLTRTKIFKRDGYECAYCGKEKEAAFLVVDHVVPRKKGGDNKPGNLVAACVPCNSKKSDLLLEEYCLRYSLDFKTLNERVFSRVSDTLQEEEEEKEKDLETDGKRKGDARGKPKPKPKPIPEGDPDTLAVYAFWKKLIKASARKADALKWIERRGKEHGFETVVMSIVRYKNECNEKKTEEKFLKECANFFGEDATYEGFLPDPDFHVRYLDRALAVLRGEDEKEN